MKESQIQSKIIKYLSQRAYVIKTIVTNRNGVPDVIICYKGKFVAFEIKAERGVLSSLQTYNLTKIKENGGYSASVKSLEEVKDILAKIDGDN